MDGGHRSFQNPKNVTLRFVAVFHTFSRTMLDTENAIEVPYI